MKKPLAVLIVCGFALSAACLPNVSVSADPKPAAHQHGSRCADLCAACANTCSACVEHCVLQLAAGKKEHAATLRLCNDCADLCSLAAKIESRGGPLHLLICEACAKACDRCAAECSQFKDQPHMVQCAKACVDCAAACREMIQHAGHAK
ncbi:MAG: four-helix bundle copper-binding protein [Planctomycetaceae bacterium]|jgi:hypothetical protein|nr:four-helix bundle copper-binding protein [Planctomycetaceae bacterium]